MLDEKRKPASSLADGEINLPRHMAEHLYMFSGESIRAKFKAESCIIDQMIDWFGSEPKITAVVGNECIVEVTVNRGAFFCWAMQYGLYIEVLEPVEIREQVIDSINKMSDKYNISRNI